MLNLKEVNVTQDPRSAGALILNEKEKSTVVWIKKPM